MAYAVETYEPVLDIDPGQVASSQANELVGIAAEQGANVLTAMRGVGTVALYRHITANEDYQSWRTVAAFASLAATDAEGKLARWGRKLRGKDEDTPRPFQSYFDHLTDKALVDGTMKAIEAREKANGNSVYAGAVATAANITITRDVATTVDRAVADVQCIDTRAQKAGKAKALKQYATIAFALSPLAKSKPGQAVAAAGLLATAKDSVTSGWKLHKSFSEKRRQRS